MKLATNEGFFRKIYSSSERRQPEDAVKICKNCGFDNIDFGLTSASPEENLILRTRYTDEAKKFREYCERLGARIIQTHARYDFNRVGKDEFISEMIKTVEVSKILGADNVVVHADTYYDKEFRFEYNEVLNTIYDIYAPMVEAAKKHGVKIAMETLFEDRAPKGKRARFTSYVNELDDIVSKFGDPIVGICWDFGHARVSHGDEQFEEMRKVGDKIIATHVHDNHWSADMHLLPFEGDTDWNEGMKTLKEIGYSGALTFEMVYGCVPDELIPDYAAWCRKVGEYLISIFENRKQK